ncbi:MAG: hypothetical protein K2X27_02925 [Candidatus Obscuribacterales bacterium]|nr:hypothetical protein [Candidatus Obscuribacterales bacterium]
MSYLDEVTKTLDAILPSPPRLRFEQSRLLAPILSRQSAVSLIDCVLADKEALLRIAARSYTHTLGFRKIVLLDQDYRLPDGSKGFGYQLRLHLWEPDCKEAVPLLEAMHEHAFDFTSVMLTGAMENQCYEILPLSPAEQAFAARIQVRLAELSNEELRKLTLQLEILEARRLQAFGSEQASCDGDQLHYDESYLKKLLALEQSELDLLLSLQGRYRSVLKSTPSGGGGYVHRLSEFVKLVPVKVLRLAAGDLYHHPHPFAHRLYAAPGQRNSTLIITTPVSQDAVGGSFQRPSASEESDVQYARKMYSCEELHIALSAYREELLEENAVTHQRFFNVAD